MNVNLRFVSRLCWFCSIGVFATFSFSGVVQAQQRGGQAAHVAAIDRIAALRSGTLLVWESGSPGLLGWDAIHDSLATDFPDLRILFQLVQPQNLMDELSKARSQGALPDVVFVDNWNQGGPLISQQSVMEMMGRSRFSPSHGWWFLMRDGKNQAMATAFLQWLGNDPHWKAPQFSTAGMTQVDRGLITSAVARAVSSLAGGSESSAALDPDAFRFATSSWGTDCGSINEMANPALRFIGGNGRTAFAALTTEAKSSGGRVACGGLMDSFLVLRKLNDRWKVLLLMPDVSLPQAVSFGENIDLLSLSTKKGMTPAAPILLEPQDGEQQTRFPKQDISWQQDNPRPAAYVVESRFGQPGGAAASYGPSMIYFVDPAQYVDVVKMPMPFGVGKQPHRWRVWAVGKDGQIALSEWRTVNFTN